MSKGGRVASRPVVLMVLDGWGHRTAREGNAIELGHTPVWHRLWNSLPRTLLDASGRSVGLPDGQMGNSEVGHLNLGAGRVVPQDIVRISDAIASGEFYQIPPLVNLCASVTRRGGTLHLIGLIGPGGVHALDRHLEGALELARRHGVPRIAIHALLDGRDTPPTSAAGYMREMVRTLERYRDRSTRAVVTTVTGRYFGMDRDRRWDRTRQAYDAMVRGLGRPITDPVQGILNAYARGETDEFVKPMVLVHDGENSEGGRSEGGRGDGGRSGKPVATIQDGDGVVCFNFRADRMRQIVRALVIDGFDGFDPNPRPKIEMVTMTQYDATFPIPVAFEPFTLSKIVAEVLAGVGRTSLRTAETEKYAHVTYFFNGGVEVPYPGEERILVDSQRVATYDLKPEMSAPGVTDVLCQAIEAREHDFILCNYANGDMVGHTGVLPAAIKAVETVDLCLRRTLESAERADTVVLITADHGNCELMVDPATGGPHTAHTTNPVPFLITGDPATRELRAGGSLRDVGPTVLNLLGVEVPPEMTGRDLRSGAD
ncbi:MAG: 2,3-bisphosphoglycerate-independent phosphoglycerate mutase [Gemmatimonadetes bacterium]|nr:2,3-bisphosphoglycerate-independent phosphoglycerate mutase [Gemmatimonadota bacterium]